MEAIERLIELGFKMPDENPIRGDCSGVYQIYMWAMEAIPALRAALPELEAMRRLQKAQEQDQP
jgi:hypothetical protein